MHEPNANGHPLHRKDKPYKDKYIECAHKHYVFVQRNLWARRICSECNDAKCHKPKWHVHLYKAREMFFLATKRAIRHPRTNTGNEIVQN